MIERRLAADTDPDIERMQVASWRDMPSEKKAALISGLSRTAFAMAEAGVRHRFPDAKPRELKLRLAIQVHGLELALRAFPDAAELVDP